MLKIVCPNKRCIDREQRSRCYQENLYRNCEYFKLYEEKPKVPEGIRTPEELDKLRLEGRL